MIRLSSGKKVYDMYHRCCNIVINYCKYSYTKSWAGMDQEQVYFSVNLPIEEFLEESILTGKYKILWKE